MVALTSFLEELEKPKTKTIIEYIQLGEFPEVEAKLLASLEQSKKENDLYSMVLAYSDLGDIYRYWAELFIDDEFDHMQELSQECRKFVLTLPHQ